ncbi:VanW family protein [Nocardioides sp. TRM66260-LWL]|uniref:VanW family protein n=1 Tax=Nocardioides sp. TRM66260-LWL TaxID=2874478 RepID=UPI001CC6E90C|nr:VanW family protein [Nocardioides sp. TRM66260-LWL]MBZ5735093.1 VanW family protein [Nocardioides sp. TRM66260-LWL]
MQSMRRERSGASAVVAIVVVLVLLVGGGYAAAHALAGDRLPRDTRIAGIGVGGLAPDEARARLQDGLAARVATPLAVRVDGRQREVDPADAGLSVDYAASVAAAQRPTGWSPRSLWSHFTDRQRLDPVVRVDAARMRSFLDGLSERDGEEPRDAQVRFTATGVETTAPRPGRAIDVEAARNALEAAFLADPPAPIDLSATVTDPDIDAADLQRALDEFANPAMSAAITLRLGRTDVELRPSQYASVLSMEPSDGVLVPRVDAAALAALVAPRLGAAEKPVDATVVLVDGRPQVRPARVGVRYRSADLQRAFLDALTRPSGRREVTVRATTAQPKITTKQATDWRIREKVSSFTTYFPYAEYRNVNIGRAAELIDGIVLPPGRTFSLNGIVGERTVENGFTKGFIISDGIFKEDLGGGVSQVATTTFNAMFFAGLQDVEHKAHSLYIDRYPVGREATVAWGSVDLRFRNDTRYGVLVDTRVVPSTPSSRGSITVTMWSTKVWDVSSSTGPRYDVTQPSVRRIATADCVPNAGAPGFSVDVTRTFRRPGSSEVVRTQRFRTTYIAADRVICTGAGG